MKRVGLLFAVIILFFTHNSLVKAQATDSLLITEVMLASNSSASSEFIEIYNQSDSAINLTDLKLQYQAGSSDPISGTWTTKVTMSGQLKAHGFALLSSSIFNTETASISDFQFNPGLSGSSGRIRLFNGSETIDSVSWGGVVSLEGASATAPQPGFSLKRTVDSDARFIDTNNNSVDFLVSDQPFAQGGGVEDIPNQPVDVCPETPAVDTEIPEGYMIDNGICIPIPQPSNCDSNIKLSEFLTDPVGLEANGGEFIELYNPDSSEVSLLGCTLISSKSTQPLIEFTDKDRVSPGGYFVVQLTDKLTNSSGSLTLSTFDTDDIVNYNNLKEGQAMALFDGVWEMTNQPTPNGTNLKFIEAGKGGDSSDLETSSLEPCDPGKYRNPATNRCKSIESLDSSLAPCDSNQFRNPETNRCKSISSASSTLQPCSAGQERNPSTNRCKKISLTSSSLKPCEPGYERNPETNRCRKTFKANNSSQFASEQPGNTGIKLNTVAVGSFMTAALGYAAYEYRTEISNAYKFMRSKLTKGKPPD